MNQDGLSDRIADATFGHFEELLSRSTDLKVLQKPYEVFGTFHTFATSKYFKVRTVLLMTVS